MRLLLLVAATACSTGIQTHDETVVPMARGGLSVAVARIETDSRAVRRLLAQKRAQRDVVSVLCLNDKLGQLNVALRSAHERRDAADLAKQQGDYDLAAHEAVIVTILRQRADQLLLEGQQCV